MQHDTYSDLHAFIRDKLKKTPEATEAEVRVYVWAQVKRDLKEYARLLFDNWFNANWATYEVHVTPGAISIQRRQRKKQAEQKECIKEVAHAMVKKTIGILLMGVMLPNGKVLRDATFADCRKAGGWLGALGKLHATGVVGKTLTEADVQNIWKRYA